MFGIKSKVKHLAMKYGWMKNHPDSIPMSHFDPKVVSMGKWSYGELNITSFNNKSSLRIGSFVSIAQNVHFLLDVEHDIHTLSQYPFKAKMLGMGDEAGSKGDIIVDDDVWIGHGATILSGVHIGQGAVVAAGAVISKDVEPYAIVGGVPAKVIRYRFDIPVIEFLLTLDYAALDRNLIEMHVDELYMPIDEMKLGDVKKYYSWFPKKYET